MQFTIAAAVTGLLATTAFAAPTAAPADPPASPPASAYDARYKIADFTTRKTNGVDISTLSFRIQATNEGTLDFECVAYDPVKDGPTDCFEPGHVYACGKDNLFSFSYVPKHDTQTNELFLWQNTSPTVALGGSVLLDDPKCIAGGNGDANLVCTTPKDVNVFVTLKKLGA
jgi:hypothetical protein